MRKINILNMSPTHNLHCKKTDLSTVSENVLLLPSDPETTAVGVMRASIFAKVYRQQGEIWESLALTSLKQPFPGWAVIADFIQRGVFFLFFFVCVPSSFLASCGRAEGKFWCHQPWHSGTEEHAAPRGATIGARVFVPRRWRNRWCGAARLRCTCVPACWLISLVMWNVTICSPGAARPFLCECQSLAGRWLFKPCQIRRVMTSRMPTTLEMCAKGAVGAT